MQKTRKPLSLLLTLCMIVSLFAGLTFSVSADEGQTLQVNVEQTTTLEDGNIYLITDPTDVYAMSVDDCSAGATLRAALQIIIADGVAKLEDGSDMSKLLWTAESAAGGYKLKVGETYLWMSSGSLYTNSSGNSSVWTFDSGKLVATAASSYIVGFMESWSGFKGFNKYSSDATVKLYKVTLCTHANRTSEVTVAATCTADGSYSFHCDDCNTDVAEVLPALGHKKGELKAETTTYWEYECTRCNEIFQVMKDARLGIVEANGVDVSFSTDGSYEWAYDADNNRIQSTNNGKGSTHSITTITFTAEKAFNLSFDYSINSESYYDYLTLTLDDAQIACTKVSSKNGTLLEFSYPETELAAGTHTLVLDYVKDTSGDQGEDRAYLSNLKALQVCDHVWVKGETTDPTCTEQGYTSYECSLCHLTKQDNYKAALGHDPDIYTDNGDGTHSFSCKRDGCSGGSGAHSYTDGLCICGVVEPVIIGSGTAKNDYPFYLKKMYSVAQMIYTADEIISAGGKAGNIQSVAFSYDGTESPIEADVQVYIGYTDKTQFGTDKTDFLTEPDLQLVYNGKRTLAAAAGWDEIKLDTPFAYDGQQNLVIAVTHASSTAKTLLMYNCVNGKTGRVLALYGDSESYSQLNGAMVYSARASALPQLQLRITEAADLGAVAKIGDQTYTSLKAAVTAAEDGETVTLLEDTTEGFAFSKSITLDLGGKKLTGIPVGDETMALQISAGKVTVQNGTVAGRVNVYDDADVTIAETLTITNSGTDDATAYGIVVYGEGTSGKTGCQTPTLSFYGTIKVTGNAIGITTNGLDESAPVINVYPGAVITADENGTGIYLPAGTLTVTGGTVTGATAIYFKSTNMTISGGTFNGIGAKAEYKYNGNGLDATGDAIVIDNCNYPNGTGTIAITGGTFNSTNAKPVASYAGNGQDTALSGFVSGGTFNNAIENALCASGFECVENENGTYGVEAASVEVFELKATDDGNGTITVEVIAKRDFQFSVMELYLRCSYGKATLTGITGTHVDKLVNLKTGFAGLYAVDVESFTVAKGEVLATYTYTYDAADGEDFRFRLSTGECYLGTEYEDELPWSKDYASLPEEERPEMPKAEVGTPDPDPTGFNVTVDDRTKGTATVDGIEATMSGNITFTVANDKACVVLVRTGEEGSYTYTRLTATETATENTYSFTTTVTGDITIIVAIKGDVNGDGNVDSTDTAQTKAISLGRSVDDLKRRIADVSGDAVIDSTDVAQIKAVALGGRSFKW